MSFSFYLRFSLVIFFDIFSALASRYAFNHQSAISLLIAMGSSAMAGYFFITLLKDHIAIIMNALWIAFGAMGVTLASYFVFKEALTFPQGVGMAIIVAGIILIRSFEAKTPPL